MGSPPTLCMIGAGGHASRNVYPCFAKAGLRVVANCDLDLDRARAVGATAGIARSYADHRAMLTQERPDGVLICVSSDAHADLAIEAMAMGFHVYTEKPPAADLARARAVLATQQQTGRICMTGFKKRYAPAYRKLREVIADQRFGQPALLSIVRTSGHFRGGPDPRADYLLESGIHVVDLVHFLYGPVVGVNAVRRETGTYAATLRCASGAVCTLSLTDRMSYQRGWELVTAIGDGGVCASVDNSVEMIAFHHGTPFAAHKPEFVAGSSDGHVEMGFVGELQAFATAIAEGHEPSSSIASSVHTMELIAAIKQAANAADAVHLDRALGATA